MVKDLGPVSTNITQIAHEPAGILQQQAIGGKGLRYLDIGYHEFVPASMQYRMAILEDSGKLGAVGQGTSLQLGAQNIKGKETDWKRRLDNYTSWQQQTLAGIQNAPGLAYPDIPVPDVTVNNLMEGVGFNRGEAQSRASKRAKEVKEQFHDAPQYKPFDASYWGELVTEFIYGNLHNEMMSDPDYSDFYQTNAPSVIQELIKGPGGQSIDMGMYTEQDVKALMAELYLLRKTEVFGKDTDKLLGPEFFHGTEETNLVVGKYFQKVFKKLDSKDMGEPEALKALEEIVKDFNENFTKQIKAIGKVQDLSKVDLESFYLNKESKAGISKSQGSKGVRFGKFGAEIVDRIVEIARTRIHNNIPVKGYWLYVFPIKYGSQKPNVPSGGMAIVRIEPTYAKGNKGAYIDGLQTRTGIIPMGNEHVGTLYQFGVNMAMSEGIINDTILSEWLDLMHDDVAAFINFQAGRGIVLGQILDDAALKYMGHIQPFVGLKRLMTKGDIAKSIMEQVEDFANITEPAIAKLYDNMIQDSHHLTNLWREVSAGNPLEVGANTAYLDANSVERRIGIWNRGNFGQTSETSGISAPFIINLTGSPEELPVTDDFAGMMGIKPGSKRWQGAYYDIAQSDRTLREKGPLGQEVIKARGMDISFETMMRFGEDEDGKGRDTILREFYKNPNKKIGEWGATDIEAGERYRGLTMDDKGSAIIAAEWKAMRKSQGRTWAGMASGMPTQKFYKEQWKKHASWRPNVDPTSGMTREEYDESLNWELWEQSMEEEKNNKKKRR